MAHLWIESPAEPGADCDWCLLPLEQDELPFAAVVSGLDRRTRLVRTGTGVRQEWHLLAEPDNRLRVNGSPLLAGFRVLADRDEIRIPGFGAVFFSTERLARIEPFAGASDTSCPRCRQVIEPGAPAVLCPACSVWHHGSGQPSSCWLYAPGCAMCGYPTPFDTNYQWTPEAL